MICVIFSATILQTDEEYFQLVDQLRTKAVAEFRCLGIESYTDGDREITLSFWPDLNAVAGWKKHPLHLTAQKQAGRWYRDYRIRITQLIDHQ